jgi:uncharacterized protein YgiM (DUF1202 family)
LQHFETPPDARCTIRFNTRRPLNDFKRMSKFDCIRNHMMKQKHLLSILLLTSALFASACTPVVVPTGSAPADTPAASESITDTVETAPADGAATATVTTRSLRVRNAPVESAEVIAGINQNEQYRVLGISSDGLWVHLAIDGAPGGSGWVSSSFVTVEGPITDIATVTAPVVSQPITPSVTTTATTDIATTVTASVPTTATADSVTTTTTATVPTTATASIVTTTTTVIPTPAPGFAVVVTDGTRLRVRSEPTADSEIVGYVYNGETYPVIEVSADGAWVHIGGSTGAVSDNPDGGWVAAEFVVTG